VEKIMAKTFFNKASNALAKSLIFVSVILALNSFAQSPNNQPKQSAKKPATPEKLPEPASPKKTENTIQKDTDESIQKQKTPTPKMPPQPEASKNFDFWNRQTEQLKYGGADLFFPIQFNTNPDIKDHFPMLSGIGASVHLPLVNYLIFYNKITWLGLFNQNLNPPEYLESASLTKFYFNEGIRLYYLFAEAFIAYGQIGWNLLMLWENAKGDQGEDSSHLTYTGLEFGGGIKYMLNNWGGIYLEVMTQNIVAGENDTNLGGIQINIGLFYGFLEENLIGKWFFKNED
jgi:hypothetical protein